MATLRNDDLVKLKRIVELFDVGLSNKDVLVLYEVKDDSNLHGFIFKFRFSNLFHLLGLKFSNSYRERNKNNIYKQFLKDIYSSKLRLDDLVFTDSNVNTCREKLEAIYYLVSLNGVRLFGNFNYFGSFLEAKYTLGGNKFTLAIDNKDSYYYYPKSLLYENMKKTSNNTYEVHAVLVKNFQDSSYANVLYWTNKFKYCVDIPIEPFYHSLVKIDKLIYNTPNDILILRNKGINKKKKN